MIDRFGKDIPIIKMDAEYFKTVVEVAVSPQFLGWIAGLGDGVEILAPEFAVEEMRGLVGKLRGMYEVE